MMEEKLKQRLIGATVLVGLGVIFIPMLLDNSEVTEPKIEIPPKPDGGFASRVIPLVERPIEVLEAKPPEQAREEPKSQGVVPVEPIKEVAGARHPPKDEARQGNQEGPVKGRGGTALWAIQLASFSSEEKAVALKTRLQKRGYTAFMERIQGKHGKVFRVRVGPVSQSSAKELQAKLAKEVKLKGIVVRYP